MDDTTEHQGLRAERLLLRVEEAAEILGLSRSFVYVLMRSRDLESVTIGRSRRIPIDSLHDYVARLRSEASADA